MASLLAYPLFADGAEFHTFGSANPPRDEESQHNDK
jgi:hypothetical protein